MQHVYDDKELEDIRARAPDVKESFECGWDDARATMPNIWLPHGILPGFKEACLDFYCVRPLLLSTDVVYHLLLMNPRWMQTCHDAELKVLRAIAAGLGIADDHLVNYHNAHDNQLRLLHYPR